MKVVPTLDLDDFWLKPQYRELLDDAEALSAASQQAANIREKGRLGRAAVVLALATVEAASNDALAAIVDFYGDVWPSEARNDPPWVHFRGRRGSVPTRLLNRGRLERKTEYLIALVWRCTPVPDLELNRRLKLLVLMRNRIVHLKSLAQPSKVASVLHGKQIGYVAKQAADVAGDYVWFLEEGFGFMNLTIGIVAP